MSGFGIVFTVDGVDEVAAMFEGAADRGGNMNSPLQKSSQLMLKTFDMNFNSEGGTLGMPWKPRLEPYGWPILQRTGLMRRSFGAAFGTDFVTLFNSAPYFKYHQSSAPRTTRLPRRVMMRIDDQRRTSIIKYFQSWIMGQ